jgi:hypothetical protein
LRRTRSLTASAVSLGLVLKHSFAGGAFECATLISFSEKLKTERTDPNTGSDQHAIISLRFQFVLHYPLRRFSQIGQAQIRFVAEVTQSLVLSEQPTSPCRR